MFERIQKGQDPTEDEKEDDLGSDSCPSDDNFDLKELYDIIYCQRNKSLKVLQNKEKAEKKFARDFSIFVKQVQRKVRDASRDSNKGVCNIHMHREDHNCEKCKERARMLALRNVDKSVRQAGNASNQN